MAVSDDVAFADVKARANKIVLNGAARALCSKRCRSRNVRGLRVFANNLYRHLNRKEHF